MTYSERDQIIRAAASNHGTTSGAILSADRRRKNVEARRECALQFRVRGCSFPEIGRILGRHHTTVMYLIQGHGDRIPAYIDRRTMGEP